MAMVLQMTTFLQQYLYAQVHEAPKSSDAIRLGILSTASINSAAIINPAKSHGGVIVSAIASRDLKPAQETAKKYGIPKAYGSYEELLNEPGIDAVYISLPNGMHGEWTKKALNAGKHVLLEKPFTANAEEAREIVKLAVEKNLVLVEAFHWQFHPAAHAVKAIIDSGKYGQVLRTSARMTSPAGSIPRSDIRWEYNLAGGSLMDMTYVVSSTRYFVGPVTTPREVAHAKARPSPHDPKVDDAMEATLRFDVEGRMVESKIYSDMWRANVFGLIPRIWEAPSIEIELEHATIYFYNFMMPHIYHYVTIYDKRTRKTTTEKHYSGGPKWGTRGEAWWSTYRYQLEAFADAVREQQPPHWIELGDSIAQMETIDMVYEKSGLGKRQPTQRMV
ncbi:NAD binding Rossmann fold oxidoreductase [Dichomitus squalens]|uniref:D-xylose 1-dehydrogenase (NADP(+), D-xylono-1,5-lactone-forming) n=1 Tax=Dichomitus squalens TaxID=114155 RepID=A0A4Q9P7S6_9APHY|nr:NAD binding Rossmann fold oxidoreductase [Dichomitus squalens LYAD-421 SS1]EJF64775.1 NAD binding Rossmann fold oxidoreductase [Dichomitus squalens LYAD-421 SS1]TBU50378.1 NAD binding Rossmann fold oxidoreductase [Dichomitus squalens]TBU62917.1 NAD binding Rossmann fold oxidoreductase [Dichomitus squalens]